MPDIVYMIDNGGSFSDHCISFVETEWPITVVEECVALATADNRYLKHYVAAIFEKPKWFGDVRRTSLAEYVSDYIFGDQCVLKPEAESLPTELLESAAHYFGCELKRENSKGAMPDNRCDRT